MPTNTVSVCVIALAFYAFPYVDLFYRGKIPSEVGYPTAWVVRVSGPY
jgi:hypothetical protein